MPGQDVPALLAVAPDMVLKVQRGMSELGPPAEVPSVEIERIIELKRTDSKETERTARRRNG